MGKRILGYERTCVVCGKVFQLKDGWLYRRQKRGKTYCMCSWHCLKAWDEKNRLHPIHDRRERMIQAIRDGLTTGEIMVLLGETADRVERCRARLKEEDRENERKTGAAEPD